MCRNRFLLPLLLLACSIILSANSFDLFTRKYHHIAKEAFLSTDKLVKKYGYKAEVHTIQTEDGYLLKLYHVPSGKDGKNNVGSKCTVLLVESLSTTSKIYFDNVDNSLGFNLADVGCDVWAGEMRGTPDSRHVNISRRSSKFWDHCVDEMAAIDAPAHIDFIRKKTGVDKVFFIGYSRGTTVGFAMLSGTPEMNKKVAGFVALAPVISCFYCTSLICPRPHNPHKKQGVAFVRKIAEHGHMHLHDSQGIMHFLRDINPKIIVNTISLLLGYDPYLINETRAFVYAAHFGRGLSLRTIIQLQQPCLEPNSTLTKYDFGVEKNMERYNSTMPPRYDLTQITAPTLLLAGPNDPYSTPIDATRDYLMLNEENSQLVFVNHPLFQHADFYTTTRGRELVSTPIIDFFQKHV